VDEISETKTPKPGEWWVSGSSLIAYVVGLTLDGDPAWQQKGSRKIMSDEMKFFLACFHHEPRCTGFDWVEPPAEVCRTINVTAGDGWRWVENSEPWLKGDDCLVCDLKQPHTHNSKCWRRRVEPPKPASPDPGEGYECVPVRLFMDERNNVFAVRGEWPIIVGTQIKHDAGGFYAEGQP